MANLNKVLLLGNVTRDPEVRYTPKGSAVCDLGVAVNRAYTTDSGEKREDVTFVDVTLWGRTAEVASEYLKKGRPVFIEGAGGPVTGLPEEEKSIFTLYPNPNHGEFYVDRKVKVLHILSLTGQSLPFHTEEDGEQQKISIPNVSSGLYLLKMQQGTSLVTKKIVVR